MTEDTIDTQKFRALILEKIASLAELDNHLSTLLKSSREGVIELTEEDARDAIYAFREEFALNGLLKAYNLLVDDEEFKGYERASDEICRADFEKLFKLLYKDKLRESRAVENRRLS